MGSALVGFYQKYNWTRTVVISKKRTDNRNVFCDYSYRSVEVAFQDNGIEIADYIPIYEDISDVEIDRVLDRARQRGRVILLCTEIVIDKRRILLAASRKGMTDENYVYILPDHIPTQNVFTPWMNNDELDVTAREAYLSAFQISVAEMAGPDVEAFRDTVSQKMADPPWNYNFTVDSGLRGSEYSAFLHDVVYLYLLALNETLTQGLDYRNGTLMFEQAKGKSFRGMTGTVQVDSNGDRQPDYWIWDLGPGDQEFHVALQVDLTTSAESQNIREIQRIIWRTPNNDPPPSTPVCGFSGEFCPAVETNFTQTIVIVSSLVVAVAVTIIVIKVIIYRRIKLEREIAQELWKINYTDIQFTSNKVMGSISQISMATESARQLSLTGSPARRSVLQIFSHIGQYKGMIVAIKKVMTNKINFQRPELLELKVMKDLNHENVAAFVGICLHDLYPCILTSYCSKGSLEDIIENDDIKLDWMFKVSLITDLTAALSYLHSSPLHFHGNLKSSNCVVDNRWVLKVTDYGLCRIRNQYCYASESNHRLHSGLFWTAPELLQNDVMFCSGSEKSDIYAFGILLFEILYRRAPYDTAILSPSEIILKVRARLEPPFRPTSVINSDIVDWKIDEKTILAVKNLMHDCWTDIADLRPTMTAIKQVLKRMNAGKKINIVDNMVTMLEKYAVNLEGIVEQRTIQLLEEKKKTDILLYRMLPPTVAEKLKKGQPVEPEIYDSVTIYFSDIVGFTSLSSVSTPIQIVDLLNTLYTEFDDTIGQHDVYKVETIGDAYMAVSGLPVRNSGQHIFEIANLSLDLLRCAKHFKIRHKPGEKLQLRIGFHTGSCAAGVVGITMPRYCLFGDTVNMASRMESTGEAMKIHISQSARDALCKSCLYEVEERGEIEVKGKGHQMTYWLLGKTSEKGYIQDIEC